MVKNIFRQTLVVSLLLFCSLTLIHCTSSDDDTSVLEAELENIDSDQGGDEIADMDLVDEVDEGDEFVDVEKEEIAGLDEELEGELDVEDKDIEDEELDNDSQVVSSDELDSDDDFSEFNDEVAEKPATQNKNSLEEELNQQPQEYPVTQEDGPQFPEEVIAAEATPQDPSVASTGPGGDQAIVSQTQEITAATPPPMEQLPQDDLGIADPILPEDNDEFGTSQSWVPVVKIKTDPFIRNGRMMNSVYIVRPKDSMGDVSDKIFGSDKIAELKEDNPHLRKGIDPGDKIYYNSPNRPEDDSQIKVYYDDIGLKPQYYTTKSGDNMRRLGSKLLGFPEGWKEVWAINSSIDSKTILPGGVEIKYWTGNEQNANMEMAGKPVEELKTPPSPEQEEVAMGSLEDFPEDLPPEPPLPEAEIAMPENSLEPEMVPDIEPFPEPGVEPTPTPVVTQVQDQNQSLIQIGGIALLLMAGLALVAIQIKKRKDTTGLRPQSMEYTQV